MGRRVKSTTGPVIPDELFVLHNRVLSATMRPKDKVKKFKIHK